MRARKPKELTLKQILSVPCPTCGAALDGRTLPEGKSMVCSVSEPGRAFGESQGSLMPRPPSNIGVRPEGREVGYSTTQGKPSAGIRRAKDSGEQARHYEKTVREAGTVTLVVGKLTFSAFRYWALSAFLLGGSVSPSAFMMLDSGSA